MNKFPFRSLFRQSIWPAIVVAVVFIIIARLISLNGNPTGSVPGISAAPQEDQAFFKQLVENKLIYPISSPASQPHAFRSQILQMVPADHDHVLAEVQRNSRALKNSDLLEVKRQLVEKLHNTELGKAIRNEIRYWNDAHKFVAIRDNRKVPEQRKRNAWTAFDARSVQLNFIVGDSGPTPDYSIFITQGMMKTGFNDWKKISSSDQHVNFSTRIQTEKTFTLTVQVIGTIISTTPKPRRIIPVEIKGKQFSAITASVKYPGHILQYRLGPGDHKLQIIAEATEFSANQVPGSRLRCALNDKGAETFDLARFAVSADREFARYEIHTSDGIQLSNPEGEITKQAWELGLSALVGTGPEDRNTLQWVLGSDSHDGQVTLSINSKLQEIALEKLESHIHALWPNDRYRYKRRGAVVMLDADTGEILAAAGYPYLKPGVHQWDVSGFLRYYRGQGWETFRPWEGVDGHNAPGSTFKPVVAMAALNEVASSNQKAKRISKFIAGLNRAGLSKEGLTLDCVAYDPERGRCYNTRNIPADRHLIPNFGRTPLARCMRNNEKRLGLKQAIRHSTNVWFVKLSWLMDGYSAQQYDRIGKTTRYAIGDMAHLLGFGAAPMDLLHNIAEEQWPIRRSIPTMGVEGDRLFAASGELTLQKNNRGMAAGVLTQTAIGQSMTATPLQMARVFGAIATEKLVSPYLVTAINGEEIKTIKVKEMEFDQLGYKMLKAGLKSVPISGTAARAFRTSQSREVVYGKTGTANVGNGNKAFWSTWFTGWREPKQDGERRLAFACWITHATGGRSRTGGQVAAPLVADILDAYEKMKHDSQNE